VGRGFEPHPPHTIYLVLCDFRRHPAEAPSKKSKTNPRFSFTVDHVAKLRTAPGMRERAPEVWEIVVQAGRDPVTGRNRQVSRTFRGSLREA
jgi:hypothetical protein